MSDKSGEELKAGVCEQLAILSFEIARLKQKQKAYAAALRNPEAPASPGPSEAIMQLPSLAEIDMREALDALDGFYPLEYAEDGPYRWTGPNATARFQVWIDRSVPVQLDALMFSFGDERNRAEITLLVDGVTVPVHCGDKMIRSDPFPVTPDVAASEIIFHIPHTFCPAERGEEDSRRLGVAFRSVKIKPAIR
ncbi:hypothetical protein [Teichococcus rhizosphaerae]|uniref:hypothetical protein n=1 Tax=Teichococcus rhizosphaerae TaxID=1335062 RepID=UPI001145D83B|nr:hypothetical protein [Pseudoroseomonas rhizosphaerae]